LAKYLFEYPGRRQIIIEAENDEAAWELLEQQENTDRQYWELIRTY